MCSTEGFVDVFEWIQVLELTYCPYEAPARASEEPADQVEDNGGQ